jgi:rhamnulokinase
VEATAIGNVMMQAVSSGEVGSIPEARQIIARSFAPQEYVPQSPATWDEPFVRFSSLIGSS